MRKYSQRFRKLFTPIAACLAGVLLWFAFSCTEPVNPQKTATAEFKGRVDALTASPDESHNRVLLTWTPPAERVSFYVITVTVPGEPGSRLTVPGTKDSAYYYISMVSSIDTFSITSFLVDSLGDTIKGVEDSPRTWLRIGTTMGFNVNHGAIFTATRTCSLFVFDGNISDTSKQVVSMRFTQTVDQDRKSVV
jgi:hypothetical protein